MTLITNYMSEGTNNVLEGFQNWHRAQLEDHYLQSFK